MILRNALRQIRIEPTTLSLRKIVGPHPLIEGAVAHYQALRFLLNSIRDSSGKLRLPPRALWHLSHLYPVHVVRESGRDYCISGFRIWTALRAGLTPDETINAYRLRGIPKNRRAEIIWDFAFSDLVLGSALASLYQNGPASLAELVNDFGKTDCVERLLPAATTHTGLARLLSVARTTLGRHHRQTHG